MTLGSRLVCGASLLLPFAVALRAADQPQASAFAGDFGGHVQASSLTPQAQTATSQAAEFAYLGSASCARCHADQQKQWMNSLHVKMTKPVAEALIVGDFSERASFADHGRAYTFGRKDGKPFITVAVGDRAPETFSVDYTLGAKRYQGYLSTLPDGRIYVLPAFWHIASRRWVDWKEITPVPEGPHDIRQIWNANCFNCHGTNILQGYDVASTRYNSTWTEMGIGCEACHGPGREHVELMDAWEKNPASKPSYDTSSDNRKLSDTLKTLSTRSADPRRVFDTCAYCHGNKTNVFVGFRSGDRYEDFALPFLMSEPIPPNDIQGEYWPDGRPNRFNRPQALTLSGCFKAGAITCTSCHQAHAGEPNEFSLKVNIHEGRNGDQLCTQCHTTPKGFESLPELRASFSGPGLIQHTFHTPDSEGSRCINCHMSDVNWRLLTRRRDHTFQAPVPETTATVGVPNACTTCHDDKTPEWAARQMNAWWGDGDRRGKAVSLAETMYRAGSGDTTVIPALAGIGIDRSQGMVLRASAVDYIARMLSASRTGGFSYGGETQQSQTSLGNGSVRAKPFVPASPIVVSGETMNRLVAAAADPEPAVRAAAVRALGATGLRQDKVLASIVARLADEARVVRIRAAEILLTFGIVELPGRVGGLLTRAQDEYALSLRSFPDLASNHTELGWLASELGRLAEASRALDAAIRLDPRRARPLVLRGVMSARDGRFSEAARFWRQARDLEPGYPNIDRLIVEAEKRQKGSGIRDR